MAANIQLSWTNPLDVSNVDSIQVFRLNNIDQVYTQSEDVDSAGAQAFVTAVAEDTSGVSSIVHTVSENIESGALDTFQDSTVPSGSYAYGAFSHNDGGFGPGTIAVISV